MNDTVAQHAGTLTGFETDVSRPRTQGGRLLSWTVLSSAVGRGIWVRAGLLFVVLCLVKLAMLYEFRKYLFEIHWRVDGQPFNWTNEFAFYSFAALVGFNLWILGTRCMAMGTRVVRAANAAVLALGAAFILLTFHAGDKNYLYPLMHGTLGWRDLRWYLSLDAFFRLPYLAAWVLGYAFVYYGLVRTGRERFALRVTAVCAAAYTAVCLRGLTSYHDALMILDVVAIVCLVAGHGARRPLRSALLLIPLFSLASMFLLFRTFSDYVKSPAPEFIVITTGSLAFLAVITVLAWRRQFYTPWSWVLPMAGAAFLLLGNANYPLSANYQNLLCLGITLSRYFLGEVGVVAVMFVAALGYRRWRPSGSLWWLDAVNLVLITLALIDLRLSRIMGARLDWNVLNLALGETPRMMWRMSLPYLPAAAVLLASTAALYVVCLRLGRRRHALPESPNPLRYRNGFMFVFLGFLLLGLAGRWFAIPDKADGETIFVLAETSPLWQKASTPLMDKQEFLKTAHQLGMTELTRPHLAAPAKAQRNLNVVLIFQESSYNKYLSLFDFATNTQPLLSGYKDRMQVFPNFFSDFAGSINARFATFTGLYPVRDYRDFTQKRVDVKSIFEILYHHGYTCSLFYSSYLDYTGFRDFLRGRDLDGVYDADTMPGERTLPPVSWGLPEEETLRAIQSQIKQYAAQKRKFFLTYVPAAPHNPFDGTPQRFRKFERGAFGDFTPSYLNELLYMDWVVTSIVDQLRDSGLLNNTLVVITDDHGEMLGGKDGAIGHGWLLNPHLANIPLIIMDPARPGYHINDTVGSQVDLLPTILDILRIPFPAGQLCQGVSLYSAAAAADRVIYLNTFRQYGVIKGHDLVFDDRDTLARGQDGSRRYFAMRNQGARTLFEEVSSTNHVAVPSISAFDAFQENLLRNYEAYCQELRPHPAGEQPHPVTRSSRSYSSRIAQSDLRK